MPKKDIIVNTEDWISLIRIFTACSNDRGILEESYTFTVKSGDWSVCPDLLSYPLFKNVCWQSELTHHQQGHTETWFKVSFMQKTGEVGDLSSSLWMGSPLCYPRGCQLSSTSKFPDFSLIFP